jgi:molecular chaperone HtpG
MMSGSGGTGDFEVETITRAQRGTSVILHLREEALEYANTWKLKEIVGKYSDHISLPILMEKKLHPRAISIGLTTLVDRNS